MTNKTFSLSDEQRETIRRRRLQTWIQTGEGFLIMGALIWWALWATGFSFKFQLGFWLVYPAISVLSWLFSAKLALYMSKATPADATVVTAAGTPVQDIVDRLFPLTGLSVKPPFYVSEDDRPNAFATGPFPAWAAICVTRGILTRDVGMTDQEIEGVLAHELGHVKNGDVAIKSTIAIMSSIFFQIFDQVVNTWIKAQTWIQKAIEKGTGRSAPRILPPIAGQALSFVIFQLAGQLTRLIQLFVVRSRESGADAIGAEFMGDPCALARGLQKLALWVERNRPTGREASRLLAMRPMLIIDPLYDGLTPEKPTSTLWQRIVAAWNYLHLDHPPIPARVHELEVMAGHACPLTPPAN